MKYAVQTSAIEFAKINFERSKIRKLRRLYISAFFLIVFTLLVTYFSQIEVKNVQFESLFFAMELPLLWAVVLALKFAIYFSHRVPFLRKWEEKKMQKEIDRLKNSFENQYLKKQ